MKKEYKYTINGNQYEVAIGEIKENIATVVVNGEEYKVEWEPEAEPEKKVVVRKPVAEATTSEEPSSGAPVNSNNAVKAPLPGVITAINVSVGDEVKAGDTVLVLEAMKMENNIPSDRDGKVVAINVSKGDSILEGTDLIVIE